MLPAVETGSPAHSQASAFLESLQDRDDVAISEFILFELYVLLRNPAVLAKPLFPAAATDVCEAFRLTAVHFTTASGRGSGKRISPAAGLTTGVPLWFSFKTESPNLRP